ncbi:MAG: signal peptidase I [Eubacteriales bacterium]|nr:signal peptidase I [Eubacteriales bacterium]MDD4583345.1 signal peptidase I [Eubacteriales bacterium]
MKRTIFEFGRTILLALIIAFLITSLAKPTLVKGYSMYPTIKPNSLLLINKVPYLVGKPDYGDIVVFSAQVYTDEGEGKKLIKRIVGMEGDTIEIKKGIVYRNGKPLKEDYINGSITPGNMEAMIVSPNCIFVMGDNRGASLDSRDSAIGEIHLKDIVGRADLRLFPFDEIGVLE